ncbi:hypothetical protein PRIPAC_72994 [Pristionchus pacificus]|uniref:Uncharacterized protein n=1 Tax=Pristionchus pacificus TaxID=54126 RepID=A0A2A6C5B2_PRIPA|nr:hypothetical protein PRIPAC_72994 [Pristionchus pacificus]|eukprot:PDM73365.1 hypothetical protein PRIPAC_40721 [Pristionchus pacificus]
MLPPISDLFPVGKAGEELQSGRVLRATPARRNRFDPYTRNVLGLGATASPSPSISAPAIDMDRTKSATLLDDEPMMIENGKKKRKRKPQKPRGVSGSDASDLYCYTPPRTRNQMKRLRCSGEEQGHGTQRDETSSYSTPTPDSIDSPPSVREPVRSNGPPKKRRSGYNREKYEKYDPTKAVAENGNLPEDVLVLRAGAARRSDEEGDRRVDRTGEGIPSEIDGGPGQRVVNVDSMGRFLRAYYKRRVLLPVSPKQGRYAFITEPSIHVAMTREQLDEYIEEHAHAVSVMASTQQTRRRRRSLFASSPSGDTVPPVTVPSDSEPAALDASLGIAQFDDSGLPMIDNPAPAPASPDIVQPPALPVNPHQTTPGLYPGPTPVLYPGPTPGLYPGPTPGLYPGPHYVPTQFNSVPYASFPGNTVFYPVPHQYLYTVPNQYNPTFFTVPNQFNLNPFQGMPVQYSHGPYWYPPDGVHSWVICDPLSVSHVL